MTSLRKLKNNQHITYKDTFEGLSINTGKFKKLGVYTTMLKPMLDQINALLTHHSRVQLLRFDLHLPVTDKMSAASDNQVITKFFKQIKQDLSGPKWDSQKNIIHCWAREVGKTEHGHYHCMLGVNSTVRLGTLYIKPATLVWGLLDRRWSKLSGGSLNGSGHHVVNRSNKEELDTAFHHLSYICKVRDKQFGTGENHKRFSPSRLPPKERAIQLLTTDCQPHSLECFMVA
ncbi:MAG: YagK/YfjJ domain-containing protein [Pseudomonas sp.]